jgi:hypothetical protein
MSFVERFKARREKEPYIWVELDDIKFKVERWSNREFNELLISANGKATQAGIKTAIGGLSEYTIFAVLDLLKRHIIDWEHTPKEEGQEVLKFSKALIEPMIDNLTTSESADLFTKIILAQTEEVEGKK